MFVSNYIDRWKARLKPVPSSGKMENTMLVLLADRSRTTINRKASRG
jgi:hypothetical protein